MPGEKAQDRDEPRVSRVQHGSCQLESLLRVVPTRLHQANALDQLGTHSTNPYLRGSWLRAPCRGRCSKESLSHCQVTSLHRRGICLTDYSSEQLRSCGALCLSFLRGLERRVSSLALDLQPLGVLVLPEREQQRTHDEC